jgi:hypothetical protein
MRSSCTGATVRLVSLFYIYIYIYIFFFFYFTCALCTYVRTLSDDIFEAMSMVVSTCEHVEKVRGKNDMMMSVHVQVFPSSTERSRLKTSMKKS